MDGMWSCDHSTIICPVHAIVFYGHVASISCQFTTFSLKRPIFVLILKDKSASFSGKPNRILLCSGLMSFAM